MIKITERAGAVTLAVRLTPGASREAIEGEYQGALKVRVTAPALEDRANEALRRLLAESLNVPVAAVRIVGGAKSRNKRVSIAAVTRDRMIAFLRASQAEPERSASPVK